MLATNPNPALPACPQGISAVKAIALGAAQGQRIYTITPAVYAPAATDTVTKALDSVSAALTTDELQALNQQVEVDRKNPKTVAAEFLKSKGLI